MSRPLKRWTKVMAPVCGAARWRARATRRCQAAMARTMRPPTQVVQAGVAGEPQLTWLSGSGTRGNWQATLTLPAATTVQYKYIKKDGAGTVTWESDPNRGLTTGAGGSTQTVNDSWR